MRDPEINKHPSINPTSTTNNETNKPPTPSRATTTTTATLVLIIAVIFIRGSLPINAIHSPLQMWRDASFL
jgi:hypothetical protein